MNDLTVSSGDHLLVLPVAGLCGYAIWRVVYLRIERHLSYPQALALGTIASLLLITGLTPVAAMRALALAGSVVLAVWVWRYSKHADQEALREMDHAEYARLHRILADDPGDGRTRAALAHRLFRSGQYDEAIEHLERASADCPEMSREWNRTLGQWRRIAAGGTGAVCPVCGAGLDDDGHCVPCGMHVRSERHAVLKWLLSPRGIGHRRYRPLYAAAAVLAVLGALPEHLRTGLMAMALVMLAVAVILVLEVLDRK